MKPDENAVMKRRLMGVTLFSLRAPSFFKFWIRPGSGYTHWFQVLYHIVYWEKVHDQ
jgi:hypothetical protein